MSFWKPSLIRREVWLSQYCGGSGDEAVAIQDAINYAQGKRLLVDVAVATTAKLNGVSDIEIIGAGGSITNMDPTAGDDITILEFNAKTNFRVNRVHFIGSNKAISTSAYENGCGVSVIDCTDFDVSGNFFNDITADNVLIEQSAAAVSRGKVRGNLFSNGIGTNYRSDIDIIQRGALALEDIDVSGNFCYSPNGSGVGIVQIGATSLIKNLRVVGNFIKDKLRHGIFTYGGTNPTDNANKITIGDNDIRACNWIGIYLNGGSSDMRVHHNYLEDCAKSVVGSLPFGSIGVVNAVTGASYRVMIDHNNCKGYNGYAGIRLDIGEGCTIDANTVQGDGTAAAGGTGISAGITCRAGNKNKITNNTVIHTAGAEGRGIEITYISGTDVGTYVNSKARGNIVEGASIGYVINGNDNCEVSGNTAINCTTNSILLMDADDPSADDNTIVNSALNLLQVRLTNTVNRPRVRGNKFICANTSSNLIKLDSATISYADISNNDFSASPGLGPNSHISDLGTKTTVRGNKYGTDALTGTFTCSAAVTTTITNNNAHAGMRVTLTPTNTAAGTLQGGTKHLTLGSIVAGTSFALVTASGVAAAGTETFAYEIS